MVPAVQNESLSFIPPVSVTFLTPPDPNPTGSPTGYLSATISTTQQKKPVSPDHPRTPRFLPHLQNLLITVAGHPLTSTNKPMYHLLSLVPAILLSLLDH